VYPQQVPGYTTSPRPHAPLENASNDCMVPLRRGAVGRSFAFRQKDRLGASADQLFSL
jgi:hypothetical protein